MVGGSGSVQIFRIICHTLNRIVGNYGFSVVFTLLCALSIGRVQLLYDVGKQPFGLGKVAVAGAEVSGYGKLGNCGGDYAEISLGTAGDHRLFLGHSLKKRAGNSDENRGGGAYLGNIGAGTGQKYRFASNPRIKPAVYSLGRLRKLIKNVSAAGNQNFGIGKYFRDTGSKLGQHKRNVGTCLIDTADVNHAVAAVL